MANLVRNPSFEDVALNPATQVFEDWENTPGVTSSTSFPLEGDRYAILPPSGILEQDISIFPIPPLFVPMEFMLTFAVKAGTINGGQLTAKVTQNGTTLIKITVVIPAGTTNWLTYVATTSSPLCTAAGLEVQFENTGANNVAIDMVSLIPLG